MMSLSAFLLISFVANVFSDTTTDFLDANGVTEGSGQLSWSSPNNARQCGGDEASVGELLQLKRRVVVVCDDLCTIIDKCVDFSAFCTFTHPRLQTNIQDIEPGEPTNTLSWSFLNPMPNDVTLVSR